MNTKLKSIAVGFCVTVTLALVQGVLPLLYRPKHIPNILLFLRDLVTLPFFAVLFLSEPAYCALADYGITDGSYCVVGPTPISAIISAPTWFQNIFIVLGLFTMVLVYSLIAALSFKLYNSYKTKPQVA